MYVDPAQRRSLLSGVKRPSRYVGGEWGSGPPKDEAPNLIRVCYAFPDLYEVGMSYLGYQILYSLTKALPFADAERCYAPWIDMEEAMRASSTPLWALESGRALSDFDAVGFTLQYELSYTNILTMLDLGGISLRSCDRGEDEPIILAGGPGAIAPEPVAPFIDVFCIGDGEEMLPEVFSVLSEMKGSKRADRIREISKIEGIYSPLFPPKGRVRRRIVEDLDRASRDFKMIVPNTAIVHDRAALQVFRGCTRGCRFCQAGIIDRPLRERSADSVAAQMERLLDETGWEESGLLSLATCDWTPLDRAFSLLAPVMEENRIKLSLPSLRVDAFSVDMAAGLETMRRGGLTFAPEAGTQRLRDVINKGVSDDDITAALEATFSHGWERVKLYFMMGLPTEREEDLEGITEICNRAAAIAKKYKRRGEVSASLAGFVPKPHTPFQWEAQLDVDALRERGRAVKHSIRNRKISLSYHEPEQTFLEGVFARGDSKLADVIEEVWNCGERFDGWTECFDFERWMRAFDTAGIDPCYYACRERGIDEDLPWDHIDCGVAKEYLKLERERAYAALTTPDCRGGNCNGCGWQGKVRNGVCPSAAD
jgi:radical SAM family uncharacterized protein